MILHIPKKQETQFEITPLSQVKNRIQPHRHDFYVLVYVKSGSGKQFIDYEQIDIMPNRIHLISPQQVHVWQAKAEGYSMMIYPEYLQNESRLLEKLFMHFETSSYIDIPPIEEKSLDNLLSVLAQKYNSNHTSDDTLRALLTAFLHYCLEMKNQAKGSHDVMEDERLIKIHKLIENHFKEDYTIDEYANHVNLSKQHLNRLLKERTGKTLRQLIQERKIVDAKRELAFSSNTIDSIGEKLGFFDSSNFSKYFKKQTKLSPSEFRKMFKNYQ